MSENLAMCELRERKQQSYDSVCQDFAQNHNMQHIAERIGVSGTMLRNKLNPAQSHKLDPVDLALLCHESGDYTILNTLMADLGVVTVPLPQDDQKLGLVERFFKHAALAGELSGDALAMCNAERLPRSSKRKTLAKAQAALGNLVLLINDIEHRTSGLQPLVQMGSDFLASGAPLPGLA